VTPDDCLVEGGKGFSTALTARFDNQLVSQISAFLKGIERNPETGFVFKLKIVDRSQPRKRVGHLRTCPFIDTPEHPLGFHKNEITDEESGVFSPKQAVDFPQLRFVILSEKSDEYVGIERDHDRDRE
jgi:hypothetical protein